MIEVIEKLLKKVNSGKEIENKEEINSLLLQMKKLQPDIDRLTRLSNGEIFRNMDIKGRETLLNNRESLSNEWMDCYKKIHELNHKIAEELSQGK